MVRVFGVIYIITKYSMGLSLASNRTNEIPVPQLPSRFFCGMQREMLADDLKELLNNLDQLRPINKAATFSPTDPNLITKMKQFLGVQAFIRLKPCASPQGVPELCYGGPSLDQTPDDQVLSYGSNPNTAYHMKAGEVKKWQKSFCVFAHSQYFACEDHRTALVRSLQVCSRLLFHLPRNVLNKGASENGPEAARMKYAIRLSLCPILSEFDGTPVARNVCFVVEARISEFHAIISA